MSLNYLDSKATPFEFLEEVKNTLRKKGKLFAKKVNNSISNEEPYSKLLDDYIYYLTLTDFDDTEDAPLTHLITVEEINGNGSYWLDSGNLRKKDNECSIEVHPPDGLDVISISMNEDDINRNNNNVFKFDMPNEDANLIITYSDNVQRMIVYYGLSDTHVISSDTILNSNIIDTVVKVPFIVEIPFSNVGTPSFIWCAFTTQMKDMKNTIGTEYPITDEFTEEVRTINGETFYLYVHKWKTEINKLTFNSYVTAFIALWSIPLCVISTLTYLLLWSTPLCASYENFTTIPDLGTGGGRVIYKFVEGDYGYTEDYDKYLIAADEDFTFDGAWSDVNTSNNNDTEIDMGYGLVNSINILDQNGHTTSAAKFCMDLIHNGYSDWFLPSRAEMYMMYQNLNISPTTFNDGSPKRYTTSTEASGSLAYLINIDNNSYDPIRKSVVGCLIRPARYSFRIKD